MLEVDFTLSVREMATSFCRPWIALELSCAIFARDFTVSTTNALNGDHQVFFCRDVADLSLFHEGEVTGLIIVNDQHNCLTVNLGEGVTEL